MTATPGASKRLGTAGGSEDGQVLGPKGTHKADALTTASRSRFGTGPADTISPSGDFNAGAGTMDLRGGTEVITLTGFGGTDSFTITLQEADGTKVTTAAIVRGTNAAASDVQTAIRSALTGTDLTVVSGTTDEGPYTVTYNRFYQGRRFPKIVAITGTGCTGAVTRGRTPAVRLGGGHLGESLFDGDGVGPGHSLDAPTIGTITVTDAVHEVQYLTPGAGVDGGTVVLGFRRGRTAALAYNAPVYTIQAELDSAFAQCAGLTSSDSPVVSIASGSEVVTLDFGDMSTADTLKLTYGSTESTTTLTYDAAITAAQVQTLVDEATGGVRLYTVARSSNLVYTLTRQAGGAGSTWAVSSASGFTPKGTGGYVAGALITTAWSTSAGQTVWAFTFSRGAFHGMPVRGGLRVLDNSGAGSFTDGGVADTATITVQTAGVLGSASAAYTELATYGDSVLAVAVNDTTGKEYGSGTGGAATLDAASPVVIGSLPPGAYTLVARTYDTESQRTGPAATATFTVA